MKKAEKGFTLVELSVVLLVIGLLSAVIMGGKSLIHSSNIKKIISDVNEIKTSVNLFRDRYNYFPGDFPYAWDYWGDDCASTEYICNGNGDGKIRFMDATSGTPTWDESLRAWTHMNLAGLYPGFYPGRPMDGGLSIGKNIPASPIDGVGYQFFVYGMNVYSKRNAENIFQMGYSIPGSPTRLFGGAVNAADGYYIDLKIDDGRADEGWVTTTSPGIQPWGAACGNPGYHTEWEYRLHNADKVCVMRFEIK